MSWQNVVLTLMLRYRVKRRSSGPPDVAAARRLAAKMATTPRLPPGWRIREAVAPIAGEWIEREGGAAETARTLLYLHGGGYYFCSPKTHRVITVGLAAGAEARAFVPDYRLAPEHRFPAAVEDAVRAYRGLIAAGTPARRIVLGGDSAGGGLALALLLSLRQAGDPLPAGAVLFSPWTDLAATGDSLRRNDRSDAMFHGHRVAEGARIYLGEAPPTDPLASPLYADLAGLRRSSSRQATARCCSMIRRGSPKRRARPASRSSSAPGASCRMSGSSSPPSCPKAAPRSRMRQGSSGA